MAAQAPPPATSAQPADDLYKLGKQLFDNLAPPSRGTLVALDDAMLVTPPAGLEIGFVPIVTRQEAK